MVGVILLVGLAELTSHTSQVRSSGIHQRTGCSVTHLLPRTHLRSCYRTGELQEFDPNKGKRKARQLLLLNDVLLLTERDNDGFYNLKVPYESHIVTHSLAIYAVC